MPDYKRLVSYMYNYEDGMKRNNVGYARVESRNGQCKYTIHITAPSLNEKQLKVYLFRREAEDMEGIMLGTFQIKNGNGDFKTITESAHINNTPYGLDDMSGIVLFYTERKFFATEWDSKPVVMSKVFAMDRRNTKKAEESSAMANNQTDIKAATVSTVLASPKEQLKDKADNVIYFKKEGHEKVHTPIEEPLNDLLTPNLKHVLDSANNSLEEDLLSKELLENNKDILQNSPMEKPTNETKISEEDKSMGSKHVKEAPVSYNTSQVIENNQKSPDLLDENIATESEKTENKANSIHSEVNQVEENKPESIKLDENKAEENKAEEKKAEENKAEENKAEAKETSTIIFEDHPLAKQIYKSFPRMYPFEDNEIAWSARIEPKDIGLLPTEFWGLGNNSFLLHGYYSYRHLIFARTNDKNGYSYILGVPGIYHNREKFMAKMFGFENFKCTKRKTQRTGEFGYWYIPIVLN